MKFDHPFCSRCGAPAAAIVRPGSAENAYKRIEQWLQFDFTTKSFSVQRALVEIDLDVENELVVQCHLKHIWEVWAQ